MTVDYLIWNDVHFPREDKKRYQLSLKIGQHIQRAGNLKGIYLNGDIGEFGSVSRHPKHPGDTSRLVDELAYMNKKFDEIEELFPGVPVVFICGNHSYRFFRYIRDVAPALWGAVPNMPSLLKFDERGWKYVDYGPDQLVRCGVSSLYLRHEPIGGGSTSAKTTAENSMVDIAFGHVHSYQVHTHRKFGPSPVITKAYALGWLGDESSPTFDYRSPKSSWTKGFTHVRADAKSGEYELNFINLMKLPVFYQGQSFNLK